MNTSTKEYIMGLSLPEMVRWICLLQGIDCVFQEMEA